MSKSDQRFPFSLDFSSYRQSPGGPVIKNASKRSFENSVYYGPNDPDWKAKIAASIDCTTTAIGVKHRYNRQSSYGEAIVLSTGNVFSRHWGTSTADNLDVSPQFPGLVERAENDATKNFLNAYRKQAVFIQGMVTMGEIGEIIRGFRNPLKSFRKGIDVLFNGYRHNLKKIKRINRQNNRQNRGFRIARKVDIPSELLRMFSDTWLEWSFAMKPLMADVDGGAKALADLANSNLRRFPMRVTGSGEASESKISQHDFAFPGSPKLGTFDRVEEHKVIRVIKAGMNSTSFSYPVPTDSLGFTVEEFVPSLYNLVPYSWLLDYFVNAGDIIDAWSYQNIHCSWDCHILYDTRAVRGQNLVLYTPPVGSGLGPSKGMLGASTYERLDYKRTNPWKVLYVPSIQWTIPGMGTRWLNIAALAAGYAGLQSDVGRVLRI
jgi:hypothetical protein